MIDGDGYAGLLQRNAAKFHELHAATVAAKERLDAADREFKEINLARADVCETLAKSVGGNIRMKLFPISQYEFVLVEWHSASWIAVDVVRAEGR